MEKIVAVTFDIGDQKCKMYNALEWHNFIADTRENLCPDWDDEVLSLDELFECAYGDEFWYDVVPSPSFYQAAFDLRSEEFLYLRSDFECEGLLAMAELDGEEDKIFWAD